MPVFRLDIDIVLVGLDGFGGATEKLLEISQCNVFAQGS
jgi:hypothetical protein